VNNDIWELAKRNHYDKRMMCKNEYNETFDVSNLCSSLYAGVRLHRKKKKMLIT
jgi:hypothetical protein